MDQTSSTEPFIYVIIPLIAIFLIGCLALVFHLRRRRQRVQAQRGWPVHRIYTPDGRIILVSRVRRNPWQSPPSEEGLNELGEAPPPYEGKKRTAGDNATTEDIQLRDMEEGARPPEYIAEPPSAVTTESRGSGPS